MIKLKALPTLLSVLKKIMNCSDWLFSPAEAKSAFDKSVMAMGRLGFISQFSYFPVQYMDSEGELAVFAFPPLQSSITIRRVQL